MLFENIKIALTAIRANKLRSTLTVLGIMIGVASVIAVVSLVQGLQYQVSNQLQSVGATFIRVVPDFGVQRNPFIRKAPELTYEDAIAVRRGATAIKEFTPLFLNSVETKYRDARHSTTLIAVSQSYQDVVNNWVEHGRFFTSVDEEAKKRVCVIGVEIARTLGLGDPVGKEIMIDGNAFTVVGVMEKRGSSITGDSDDILLIPFPTAVVLYGPERMKQLILALQVRSRDDIDLAKEQVTEILRTRHHIKKDQPDDFRISAQEEIMKAISGVLLAVSLVVGGVVGVGLIVAGIGIMNIMLVSVTERTREIGIRKAIGARRKDVLVQFLIEAVTLSAFGGAVGIAGGFGIAQLFRLIAKKWLDFPVHTPWWAIVGAFAFCAVIGVIFGILPAFKAARLHPIDALRYE